MTINITDKIGFEVVGDKKTQFTSLLHELQLIVNRTIDIVQIQRGKSLINPISMSNLAAIIILKRLVESTRAGELLISHGFDHDAAVLVTNQIELRLDLQYIAKDYTQAKTWLNHDTPHKKPWRVQTLIESLFKDEGDLEAEKEVYMEFSMVKHGNPVASTFGFPIAMDRNKIRNSCSCIPPHEDILLSIFTYYIFVFFGQLFEAYSAAIRDFKRCNINIEEQENKANFINIFMQDLYNNSYLEQIRLLEKITPQPELCNSCSAFPKNKIIIDCVMRRSKYKDKFSCEDYKPI